MFFSRSNLKMALGNAKIHFLICVGKITNNNPIIAHFGPKKRPTALVDAVSPFC